MLPAPIVLIVRDGVIGNELDALAARLLAEGVDVRRGDVPVSGRRPLESAVHPRDLKFCEVLVTTPRYTVGPRAIELARWLRSIVMPTIGIDSVDVDAAQRRYITVANSATPENVESLAEATVLLMLSLLRCPRGPGREPRSLAHKKVGLIGFGRVGRAVAARLQGWGVTLLVHTPSHREIPDGVLSVPLKTLLSESDIVSVHSTLNASSRRLLDRNALAQLKSGACLINTARGGLIDEDALCDALDAGRLAGAAIDVFETEPLPLSSRLRSARGTILTPHMIGHTVELFRAMEEAAYANVEVALARARAARSGALGHPPGP